MYKITLFTLFASGCSVLGTQVRFDPASSFYSLDLEDSAIADCPMLEAMQTEEVVFDGTLPEEGEQGPARVELMGEMFDILITNPERDQPRFAPDPRFEARSVEWRETSGVEWYFESGQVEVRSRCDSGCSNGLSFVLKSPDEACRGRLYYRKD